MTLPLFSLFALAFADEVPLYKLDCPFFLKWSVDWQTCVVQWNTYYGLAIILAALGVIVTVAAVSIWKICRARAS